MEKASRVMYSIANFFTWILAILSIAGIVFCILAMTHVLPEGIDTTYFNVGGIVGYSIILIVAIITISMVRRAKAAGSSKGWDVLFLVLGIIGCNIFYFLGGIFGLVARR